MKFSDFITEDSVVEELRAVDKESAIREIKRALAISPDDGYLKSQLERFQNEQP